MERELRQTTTKLYPQSLKVLLTSFSKKKKQANKDRLVSDNGLIVWTPSIGNYIQIVTPLFPIS